LHGVGPAVHHEAFISGMPVSLTPPCRDAVAALSLHHDKRIAFVADGPPGSGSSLVFSTVSKDLPSSRYQNASHKAEAAAAAAAAATGGGGGGEEAAAAAASDTKPCLEDATEVADACKGSPDDQVDAGEFSWGTDRLPCDAASGAG